MQWRLVADNSEEAFKKILSITRILGLLPLDDECQLSVKFIFASSALLFFAACSSVCFFVVEEYTVDVYGKTHMYIYYFRKALETFSYIAATCQFGCKREKLITIYNNLITVDQFLISVNQRCVWSLHPLKYRGNVLLTVAVYIMYLFRRFVLFKDISTILYWTIVYADLLLVATIVSQFCAFHDLMKFLLKHVLATKQYTQFPKLYSIIDDSCECLNDIYGVPIFCILTVYFLGLLHQLYQFLSLHNEPLISFVSMIYIGTYYMLLILQIIFDSNSISKEAEKFNIIFYNEIVTKGCGEITNYEEFLFHFERSKEFEFTANGFFTVNNSLMCSMILTGTTYLVILLQYS